MDWSQIIETDRELLLSLNGSSNIFIDQLVLTLTSAWTWIAMYIVLLFLIIKNNEKPSQILLVILSAALCVALASGVDNLLIKPSVARLRPSMDPALAGLVKLVDGYTASGYSFFSAHAANTFALATFLSLLIRRGTMTRLLFFWALINAWTRIYLGVHYPSDVIVGMAYGCIVGLIVFSIYARIYKRISPKLHFISTKFTSTGYSLSDIDVVFTMFALTIAYALVRACITTI